MFLTPEQKAQLPIFFSWFKNYTDQELPMTVAEKKKQQRNQALLNFE